MGGNSTDTTVAPRLAAAQKAFAGAGLQPDALKELALAGLDTPEKLLAIRVDELRLVKGLGGRTLAEVSQWLRKRKGKA